MSLHKKEKIILETEKRLVFYVHVIPIVLISC